MSRANRYRNGRAPCPCGCAPLKGRPRLRRNCAWLRSVLSLLVKERSRQRELMTFWATERASGVACCQTMKKIARFEIQLESRFARENTTANTRLKSAIGPRSAVVCRPRQAALKRTFLMPAMGQKRYGVSASTDVASVLQMQAMLIIASEESALHRRRSRRGGRLRPDRCRRRRIVITSPRLVHPAIDDPFLKLRRRTQQRSFAGRAI